MVRFLVGEKLYHFTGSINVIPVERYIHEHKNPMNSDVYYREGKYYIDTLNINLIVNDIKGYESFFNDCYDSITDQNLHAESKNNLDTYIIEWETPSGFRWRRVRQKPPYPSSVRFINGVVEFTVDTESYEQYLPDQQSITINRKWNRHTIKTTVYN
jgi:hypothetical protein